MLFPDNKDFPDSGGEGEEKPQISVAHVDIEDALHINGEKFLLFSKEAQLTGRPTPHSEILPDPDLIKNAMKKHIRDSLNEIANYQVKFKKLNAWIDEKLVFFGGEDTPVIAGFDKKKWDSEKRSYEEMLAVMKHRAEEAYSESQKQDWDFNDLSAQYFVGGGSSMDPYAIEEKYGHVSGVDLMVGKDYLKDSEAVSTWIGSLNEYKACIIRGMVAKILGPYSSCMKPFEQEDINLAGLLAVRLGDFWSPKKEFFDLQQFVLINYVTEFFALAKNHLYLKLKREKLLGDPGSKRIQDLQGRMDALDRRRNNILGVVAGFGKKAKSPDELYRQIRQELVDSAAEQGKGQFAKATRVERMMCNAVDMLDREFKIFEQPLRIESRPAKNWGRM